MAAKNYQELIVWQEAMNLVEQVYLLSQSFPADERYGLTSQIRRAAVSIPSNIAEGQVRGRGLDFLRFLRIANGSRAEVETQILIARRLGYATESTSAPILTLCQKIRQLLYGLINKLKNYDS